MSVGNYYHLCRRYQGRVVRINDRFGKVHHGRITRVTRNKVYIQPLRRPGFGYGLYGYWGFGAAYAVALGAIVGVALAAAFFW